LTEATPPFGAEPPEDAEPIADTEPIAADEAPAAEPGFAAEPIAAEPEAHVPFPVPWEVADHSPEELAPALAAVCFALNRPVTLAEAAAILGRAEPVVAEAAAHLTGSLRGGGLMLQRHQDEIQLVTRPEVAWAVQRALNPEKPGRLSRAALETLAIVAYRQPLTRAAVEAIRGVNCEAVLDSLERRGLIAEVGRQDTPGHPRLFGTTLRFLQVVGLERIENLPPLPEGLKVPELPVAAWDIAAGPEPAEPAQPGDIEVRGAAVEEPPMGADPDEGYGEVDFAEDLGAAAPEEQSDDDPSPDDHDAAPHREDPDQPDGANGHDLHGRPTGE
jgi:segregation and condensation protein B